MRISDWSSDVCSSDLVGTANAGAKPARSVQRHWDAPFQRLFIAVWHGSVMATATEHLAKLAVLIDAENMSPKIVSGLFKEIATNGEARSEERRVGKECVSTYRSRWSQDH